MIDIAICDDEKEYQDMLETKVGEYLVQMDEEYHIFVYPSGRELLDATQEIGFDIILLDIDLQGESGLKVADVVAEKLPRANIIFITNRDDLVYEALRCTPFSFVRKCCLDDLEKPLTKLVHKVKKDNFVVVFSDKRQSVSLSVYDIGYIESEKHYIYIYTEAERYRLRLKLSDCEDITKRYGFIRIHKSFLVNVRMIKTLTSKMVELHGGTILPVSRGNEERIKELYLQEADKYIDGVIV